MLEDECPVKTIFLTRSLWHVLKEIRCGLAWTSSTVNRVRMLGTNQGSNGECPGTKTRFEDPISWWPLKTRHPGCLQVGKGWRGYPHFSPVSWGFSSVNNYMQSWIVFVHKNIFSWFVEIGLCRDLRKRCECRTVFKEEGTRKSASWTRLKRPCHQVQNFFARFISIDSLIVVGLKVQFLCCSLRLFRLNLLSLVA